MLLNHHIFLLKLTPVKFPDYCRPKISFCLELKADRISPLISYQFFQGVQASQTQHLCPVQVNHPFDAVKGSLLESLLTLLNHTFLLELMPVKFPDYFRPKIVYYSLELKAVTHNNHHVKPHSDRTSPLLSHPSFLGVQAELKVLVPSPTLHLCPVQVNRPFNAVKGSLLESLLTLLNLPVKFPDYYRPKILFCLELKAAVSSDRTAPLLSYPSFLEAQLKVQS